MQESNPSRVSNISKKINETATRTYIFLEIVYVTDLTRAFKKINGSRECGCNYMQNVNIFGAEMNE